MTKKEIQKMLDTYKDMRESYELSKKLASYDDVNKELMSSLAKREMQDIMAIEFFLSEAFGIEIFDEYINTL